MTYRSIDLPFTQEGIAPDIIVNPLAFPSRMTIGMLVEMLTGKKVAAGSRLNSTSLKKVFHLDANNSDEVLLRAQTTESSKTTGSFEVDYASEDFKNDGDATPFNPHFSLRKVCEELKSLGHNNFGDEMMINGMTGEPMKCLIFTGVCYYQRLKHMVVDKIHARSRGGRNILTRQPKEGRKSGGGLRVGYMERDALLSQGVSAFTKDRLMDQSDSYQAWVCDHCGLLGTVVKKEGSKTLDKFCRVCDSKDLSLVKLPYATKLLAQELGGMNIVPRILTS